jgi:hypothetical protein
MAFTPEEINVITTRGVEGIEFPIVCTPINRVVPPGATTGYFYIPEETTQNILFLGTYAEFIAAPRTVPVTKIWTSPVTYEESGKILNGANNIRYSMDPIGQNEGQRITVYFYADDTLLNIGQFYIGVTTNMRVGNYNISPGEPIYLCFTYNNRDNTIYPAVSCAYVSTIVGDNSRYDNVCILGSRTSFQDYNQPWEGWVHQSDSDWYEIDSQVPPMTGGGGGGGFYRESDTVGFTPLPALDIANFGIFGIYKMSETSMQNLAHFLWSPNFIDNLLKNWADPFNNIVSIGFVPMDAELTGVSQEISIGNVNTGVNAVKLNKTLFKKDFGRINFKELYKNFADYSPFTKLQIYLPAAGIKELNPDNYMDGYLHLEANIDIFSGTMVYQLLSERHGRTFVVDQYQGSILTQIPITGQNFIQAYQAVINGVAAVGSGKVGSVNLGGMADTIFNIKPTYEKAGGVSGSANRLSAHVPYIFFDTPQLREAKNFRTLNGYVSNRYEKLQDCKGFVSVKYIDISGINAPEGVKDRILEKLRNGVHIHEA